MRSSASHRQPTAARAGRASASDFAAFWEAETSPAAGQRLPTTLFEQVWHDNGTIVAVKPRGAFVPYLQAATQAHQSGSGSSGVLSGSDGGRSLDCHPAD